MSGFDINKLMEGTSFEPNAILRGAQLTVVGANRALQNPSLFTSEHYKQAGLAVVAGIVIRLLVAVPTLSLRVFLSALSLITDLSETTWPADVLEGFHYIEHHVLQLPFFLLTLMRYITPTLDNLFMNSLEWVDKTYVQKHAGENPDELRAMYYPNLRKYEGVDMHKRDSSKESGTYEAMMAFLMRFGKKAALSLGVYFLSFLPYVGRFVLPAASFYTFNKGVGTPAAVVIFGSGLVLPKRYLLMFLQSYFSSRSLMRELLEPYFSRMKYDSAAKKAWFHSREGVLYGFALAFFIVLRIPLVGVLIYGIAEASTAYLITKITSPPPPPEQAETFMKRDVVWENKHEFLSLPLDAMDRLNIETKGGGEGRPDTTGMGEGKTEVAGKKFT